MKLRKWFPTEAEARHLLWCFEDAGCDFSRWMEEEDGGFAVYWFPG